MQYDMIYVSHTIFITKKAVAAHTAVSDQQGQR